jgi:hypothetical protein
LLPVELVFGHEGFLHPCVGALQNQQRQLIIYSTHLARGPNGRMWVLDDRAPGTFGLGICIGKPDGDDPGFARYFSGDSGASVIGLFRGITPRAC